MFCIKHKTNIMTSNNDNKLDKIPGQLYVDDEKDEPEDDFMEIETLIDNDERNASSLHASISCNKYYFSRMQINYFFENEDIRMVTYGSSSSDMRSHMLFRHKNGKKYVVHHAYGNWSDWFPLTSSEILQYFNDDESTIDDMNEMTRKFVELGVQ